VPKDGRGLWLDTTDINVSAVVDTIIARESEARLDGISKDKQSDVR
jgi:hypothetical protein